MWVEILKAISSLIGLLAAVIAVFGDTLEDGRLNPKGKWVIGLAAASFFCVISIQVLDYLRLVESNRTLTERHSKIVKSLEKIDEGAAKIEKGTKELSTTIDEIRWWESIAMAPIKELHLQCNLKRRASSKLFSSKKFLNFDITIFRSNSGILSIKVHPINEKIQREVTNIGAMYVGQPYQKFPIPAFFCDLRTEKEDPLIWIRLPLEDCFKSSDGFGECEWPLKILGDLKRTRIQGIVEGEGIDKVESLSLMINRDVLLKLPLEKENDQLIGSHSDSFLALRPRYESNKANSADAKSRAAD